MAEAIVRGTSYYDGRIGGSIELRTAMRDYIAILGVDEKPLRPIGGHILMGNHLSLQIVRKRIGDRSAEDFAEDFLAGACAHTTPIWGAVYTHEEYWAKVMQTSPSIEAIGRDFGRFLPGLFAVNYFGRPYLDLMGKDRFAALGEDQVQWIGGGVIVRVAAPWSWSSPDAEDRYAAVLSALGPQHFFDRHRPDRLTRAPSFVDQA